MKKRTEDVYQLTIRMPLSLYNNVKSYTEQTGIMMNEFVVRSVQEKYSKIDSGSETPQQDTIPRAEFESRMNEFQNQLNAMKSMYVASEKEDYIKPVRRV